MKPRLVSLRSVPLLFIVEGLWRASLLTTAWGQSDDSSTFLAASALNNERRTYNGTGNNIAHPEWGSVGQRQLRSVTVASYSDGISTPPGKNRPTPRELLSEVFLATPSSSSSTSALFIGWGLLVGFDLFLNADNASEPLDIACDDAPLADVWCPLGSLSEPISFDRSQGGIDADGDGARSPTNHATAYVDLDWLYGRDEESAAVIRTLESGYLNLTTDELPHLLPDGTWLVIDQRPTTMPVTFALMTLLLREHNRCCDERASVWDADTDEDAYQVCRQWTIAVFQHITENDFAVRLVGGSVKVLGAASYNVFYGDDNGTVNTRRQRRWRGQRRRRMPISENILRSSDRAPTNGTYDLDANAGADAVFTTVAIPAFYSALPSTIGLLDDDYNAANEHGIELATASADVAGLIERTGGIESIIRGAAYSRTQAVDVSFIAEVSASSPLFNLPVVAIQRGRDHGIPSYNDVREAYGLSKVTTFEDVTSDVTVQGVLEDAYGEVELLDAYTGALAESKGWSFAGPLLRAVFLEQMYRAIVGDRHHHSHDTQNEDAVLSTLSGLILNNSMVSSMALDAFTAPDTVTLSTCSSPEVTEVYLADGFKLAWNGTAGTDSELMYMTISARGIETQGMIAIGFGGEGMRDTNDFVICVVSSESTANCTDHSGSGRRIKPPNDVEGDAELEVVNVTSIGGWTSVTFARWGSGNDASDYPLSDDIAAGDATPIIYSWRSGEGIGKHPNSQRGDARVNFAFATAVSSTCDESTDYFALHGALLLVVWMLIAPYGIYQARYRKGHKSLLGNLWWEMHEECMVICAEALLPLAITAIFTTGGPHNSSHAKWGFYMIGAVVLQIATGWARSRALLAKGNNFSLFHRLNKYFHIYSGWFAYMAGLVQCYRGLELVAGAEKLVFSAVNIDFKIGNFEIVRSTMFPIWLGIVPPIFIVLEARRQFTRFLTKGSAHLCCMVEIVNDGFSDEAIKKVVEDRLMPRTENLPLYSTHEFNDKILNGRAWVIVDAAVIDVSSFAKRHPGGARLIMNSMGTDVTSEIIGEDASVGNSSMAFAPHPHSDTALEIARSLVVGYIEEEDDTDEGTEDEEGNDASSGTDLEPSSRHYRLRARRRPSLSSSDSESAASDSVNGRRASISTDGSTNDQQQRQSGVPGGKKNKAPGDIVVVVGAAMTLSAQASAIVNARSPVPKTPPPPPPPPLPPPLPARAHMGAEVGAEFGVVPVVEEDTLPFVPALAAPVSSVSGRRQKRLSRASSMSFNRPVELEHPVERNTAVPSRTKTEVTEKRPKINPIRRILGRIGTKTGVMSGGSGDESDGRQEDRYFNTSRRVRKKKIPLGFFHVCPLLMHEKMGDSADRPVYKFVFACPGRAGALVDAMTGACHFHMRVAQEAGMTVVQRSYNAFAVRVQSGEGIKRVVPACETSEGELCIEMRIRIYPDGVMSNLLLKLAKNFDNPAVQLKGPFLQDKLIPPPSHRNVIMIAAGTGINPMVQIIRNYTHSDSRTHGMLLAARSRLVLIWQNTEEGDLFCADELTMLQAKAKGLLEVTALISGDITRRNVPGIAFRHAKERLIKKSRKAGLVRRGAGGTGDTGTDQGSRRDQTLERATSSGEGGSNEFKQADAGNLDGDAVSGVPMHRHKFERELSRVTEEEHMSRESSFACSTGGFGGRDAETGGGSGGIFRSPNISRKGMEEGEFAVEIGDGNSNGVPWSTNRGDKGEESEGDIGRHPESSSAGMEERDGSRRSEEGARSAGRLEGAREPSVAASSADGSTGMGGEEGDFANSGGGDNCSILRRGSDGEGNMKRSSPTFNHEEAIKYLMGDSSDASSRVLEDTKTDGDRSGEGTRYGGVGLVDTRREASLGRHYGPKGNRMASESGRSDESGGSSGDVDKTQVAKSPRRPALGRLRSFKIRAVTHSSDNAKVDDAVGSDDGHPSRSHRPTASTLPSGSSLPPPFPSARHRLRGSDHPSARPGANTHSHLTARKTRRKWSRTRMSASDKMPDALMESPHEDLGGLQHAKLSRAVLEKAIGSDVMTAIASTKASVADASQEGLAGAEDDSRSALKDLIGTETTGGTLQVVVSGPAGFVFCAEGLLAELGIPPRAVVMLD